MNHVCRLMETDGKQQLYQLELFQQITCVMARGQITQKSQVIKAKKHYGWPQSYRIMQQSTTTVIIITHF